MQMQILGQRQFEYEMIVRIHIRNECMKGTVIYNENERNAKNIDILFLTHTNVLPHTNILRTNASQIIIIWSHAKISTYSIFFFRYGPKFYEPTPPIPKFDPRHPRYPRHPRSNAIHANYAN